MIKYLPNMNPTGAGQGSCRLKVSCYPVPGAMRSRVSVELQLKLSMHPGKDPILCSARYSGKGSEIYPVVEYRNDSTLEYTTVALDRVYKNNTDAVIPMYTWTTIYSKSFEVQRSANGTIEMRSRFSNTSVHDGYSSNSATACIMCRAADYDSDTVMCDIYPTYVPQSNIDLGTMDPEDASRTATHWIPEENPPDVGVVSSVYGRLKIVEQLLDNSSQITAYYQVYNGTNYVRYFCGVEKTDTAPIPRIKAHYRNSSNTTGSDVYLNYLGATTIGTNGITLTKNEWVNVAMASFAVDHDGTTGDAYIDFTAEGTNYKYNNVDYFAIQTWLTEGAQQKNYYPFNTFNPVSTAKETITLLNMYNLDSDESAQQIQDITIDWSKIQNSVVPSITPAGGDPLTHLPSIYYNNEPVPLGLSTYTRFLDEGIDKFGRRCWTLFIYEGDNYPLTFKALGSASVGVDIFMCGGGGGGGDGTVATNVYATVSSDSDATITKAQGCGGGGGAGGCIRNMCSVNIERDVSYNTTVGYGGSHGEAGGNTVAFNTTVYGGQAGYSGYEEDSQSEDSNGNSSSYPGLGGQGRRSALTGVSKCGGHGAIVSDDGTERPPETGETGRTPFDMDYVDSKSLAYKYLKKIFGSGGGGGTARLEDTLVSDNGNGAPGGSDMAGQGGRSPKKGKVNFINGPLGGNAYPNSGCGGGGGGCSDFTQTYGGNGGSGIIIVRNARLPDIDYESLTHVSKGTGSYNKTQSYVSRVKDVKDISDPITISTRGFDSVAESSGYTYFKPKPANGNYKPVTGGHYTK